MIFIPAFKDLTGQRFGKLTVEKRVENHKQPNGKSVVQWLCRCDCGNEKVIRGSNLITGIARSCGCLQKEVTRIMGNNKKYNTYNLSGEYGIGYTIKGEEFYFDLDDYDLIKNYCWCKSSNGYIVTNDNSDDHKLILLHRLLMNPNHNEVVDHIDHKIYNNRKVNLRICKQSQNSRNALDSINNISGFKGVCWHEKMGKWWAFIKINGKQINLGYYNDIDDAIFIREIAELKLFGEYSRRYIELKDKYININLSDFNF